MKKLLIYICAMLLNGPIIWAVAQIDREVLTLEEAISLALENNQSINILGKQVEIAENNVFRGNAGLLPTISLIGSANYQTNDTEVRIRTFAENPASVSVQDNAAASTTYSAALQAEYVILGGFSGTYRFKLLQNQRDIAYFQQQALINNTVVAVSELFLQLAKLQQQEELLERNITTGEERIKKVEDRFEYGQVSGLAILQAKTNVNTDRSLLSSILLSKNELTSELNFLLGISADATYQVQSTYTPPSPLSQEELITQLQALNPELQLAKAGIQVSENQLRVSKAQQLPSLVAFASYGYFNQQNDLQQLARIETLGPSVGLSLRYNLFTGGRAKRSIQNAQIGMEISKVQLQQAEDELISNATKAQNNLYLLIGQLEREEQNISTFQENYQRTEEKFFNGKVSSLDLRDAQNALLTAEITLNNLKADILITSLQLQGITGSLLQSLRGE
ncbi:MAG: TolC family protein [Bacteroidota bacterium]